MRWKEERLTILVLSITDTSSKSMEAFVFIVGPVNRIVKTRIGQAVFQLALKTFCHAKSYNCTSFAAPSCIRYDNQVRVLSLAVNSLHDTPRLPSFIKTCTQLQAFNGNVFTSVMSRQLLCSGKCRFKSERVSAITGDVFLQCRHKMVSLYEIRLYPCC
jgi:hypothetical protein